MIRYDIILFKVLRSRLARYSIRSFSFIFILDSYMTDAERNGKLVNERTRPYQASSLARSLVWSLALTLTHYHFGSSSLFGLL